MKLLFTQVCNGLALFSENHTWQDCMTKHGKIGSVAEWWVPSEPKISQNLTKWPWYFRISPLSHGIFPWFFPMIFPWFSYSKHHQRHVKTPCFPHAADVFPGDLRGGRRWTRRGDAQGGAQGGHGGHLRSGASERWLVGGDWNMFDFPIDWLYWILGIIILID